MTTQPSRRKFLQTGISAGLTLTLADSLLSAQGSSGGVSRRPLGKTGEQVSILGIGGWHIAKGAKETDEATAIRMMHEAIDNGLNFFDNAWDYHDGYAEELMGKAVKDRRDKVFLMTKNCERDYQGSLAMPGGQPAPLPNGPHRPVAVSRDATTTTIRTGSLKKADCGRRWKLRKRARCATSASPGTRTRGFI